MDDVPCRAFFSAARWNGHAHHSATGAAQPDEQPLPSGEAQSAGTSDRSSDRSVSGMNKMSATISRRRR